MKTPVLEFLFNQDAGLVPWTLLKRDYNIFFPTFFYVNIQNFKNSFFIDHFRWQLLNGEMKKKKGANLESSVNVQKQLPEMLYKKA